MRTRWPAHRSPIACASRRTPSGSPRALGLLIAAYALSPIDLVPDFIPVLGLIDDAILIPAGLWLFERLVSSERMTEHRAAAERAAARPVSWAGLALVLLGWAAAAVLVWRVLRRFYD